MTHPVFPPAVLDQHIAILGKTRSGKTNSAKLLIEQVVSSGSRVCIIDPIKADYWGLTSSADGKKPGLPFHIIGGARGHVPLHKGAGKAIAEVVASGALRLSIIDMEEFGPREAGPFFADFMETIFKRIVPHVYLVIDESHLFAPKEGRGGDESMATYWFKRMASGSGSKGVRLVVVTQRVQELHNTVLSNCDTVIAHRVTFPEDQKRISDWVASHASKEVLAEVKRSLPNLHRGEAWICAGEAGIFDRRQMPLCATYDNSRTPSEDDRRREVKTAQIDQESLRSVIGEAVKEAEANDPKLLKAEIAKLKRDLDAAKKNTAAPSPEQIERAVGTAVKARDRHWENEIVRFQVALKDTHRRLGKIEQLAHLNGEATVKVTEPPTIATTPPSRPAPRPSTRPVRAPAQATAGEGDESGLRPAHYRIVNALAWLEAMGLERPSRSIVAAVAGVSPKSSSFKNDVSRLSSLGLVSYPAQGDLTLTESGAEIATMPEQTLTLDDIHAAWRNCPALRPAHIKLLDAAIEVYPESLSREELAERVGVSVLSSSFKNDVSRLSAMRLIEYPQQGMVRATELVFPRALV